MIKTLKIASRKSELALKQSEIVKNMLNRLYPDLNIIIIGMSTKGDEITDRPLDKIGGKGLFLKELEGALLKKEADIAVHSIKDVPMELPTGLCISAILKREDHTDSFISKKYTKISEIPKGSIIGTSSLRRKFQIHSIRDDIFVKPIRGNIILRLKKMINDNIDGIILATSGLLRLNLIDKLNFNIERLETLPSIGQGAICVESRSNDSEVNNMIYKLSDATTAQCIFVEREMNRVLNGNCQSPIAGLSCISENKKRISLRGMVGNSDGSIILTAHDEVDISDAIFLGKKVAKLLLDKGAREILQN